MKKGDKMSEEQKIKISKANKGKKISTEARIKVSNTLKSKGIKPPSRKGKHITEEQRERQRIRFSGENNPMYGRKGELAPNYRGGLSLTKYGKGWFGTLRMAIRERDNYNCQICSKQQGIKALSIHHIDYDKNNHSPNNLISLCSVCHSKTNFNRNVWKKLFQKKIQSSQL